MFHSSHSSVLSLAAVMAAANQLGLQHGAVMKHIALCSQYQSFALDVKNCNSSYGC